MNRVHRSTLALATGFGLAACLASAACSPSARADRAIKDGNDTGIARTRGHSRHDVTKTDSLTDGDIAAIVATANSDDSAGGAVARTRAFNQSVKDFGALMVRDHGSANRTMAALAGQLNPNASPLENDQTRHMRDDSEHERMNLAKDSGAAFDRAYIDNEVKEHQELLNKLDHDLIPRAQNARLKSALTSTRTVVDSHLQRAKRIQDTLHG